jgi:hypothetical protein
MGVLACRPPRAIPNLFPSFSILSSVFDLLQDRFSMNYVFAFALGLGFVAGLRAFTPPAVVAWAAHLG